MNKSKRSGKMNSERDSLDLDAIGSDLIVNPDLEVISKILKEPGLRGFELIRGKSKISFAADIDSSPQVADDWSVIITTIPDVNQHQHRHYDLKHNDMLRLRDYLSVILQKIDELK